MDGLYLYVYTKTSWSGAWVLQAGAEPINCEITAAPAIGQATIKFRYGIGMLENGTSLTDGSTMPTYCRHYVQIRVTTDPGGGGQVDWFTGIIPAEQFRLIGENVRAQKAEQIVQAYSLDILLDTKLDKAWALPVGGGDVIQIDHLPTFNRRVRAGGLQGNSSVSKETFGIEPDTYETYVFADHDGATDAVPWRHYDIIEYLVAHYQIPDGLGGPKYSLNIPAHIKSSLEDMVGVFDFSSMTLRQALSVLMNTSRGIGWGAFVETGDVPTIQAWSILDEDLTLNGVTIPAHAAGDRTTLNMWTDKDKTQVRILKDTGTYYDKIIVRGARIKTCCTFSMADGTLEKGWTSAEETAYKDAAKNTSGYSALSNDEKAALNDRFRRTDRFDKVFTCFVVPKDWDWTVPDGEDDILVNPKYSPYDGDWDEEGDPPGKTPGPYWNSGHRLYPMLPLKEGIDYSGSTPVDKNPTATAAELRKIFAIAQDKSGKDVYLDQMEPAAASVRPSTTEMGVAIRFNPRHNTAKNHFSGAEPSGWTQLDSAGIDYDTLKITAMLETDQYLQLYHIREVTETMRTKLIEIPGLELWYIAEKTVVDIDDAGDVIKYVGTSQLLRDDRDSLKAVLAAAAAWYGQPRYKLIVESEKLEAFTHIGEMIENVAVGAESESDAVTVVSNIKIKFTTPQRMTITTDCYELNLAAIYGSGSGHVDTVVPSLKVAGDKIAVIQENVEEIKNEQNKQPVRPASACPVVVSNSQRIARITSNASGYGTYNCTFQIFDSTDWDSPTVTDPLDDTGEASVKVFNIMENGLAVSLPHRLQTGDLLVVWQAVDDEGNKRWLGFSPQYSIWHT